MDSDFYFENLKVFLNALASDGAQQRDYLNKLGSEGNKFIYLGPDELMMDFDDSLRLIDQFKEDASITEKAIKSMHTLDVYLEGMTGEKNEHLWTDEALFEAKEWEHVRFLAGRCLKGLSET
jgi:hypothetical protein